MAALVSVYSSRDHHYLTEFLYFSNKIHKGKADWPSLSQGFLFGSISWNLEEEVSWSKYGNHPTSFLSAECWGREVTPKK